MRILCTCVPAQGHFYPMVPLAQAILDAGDQLVFATAKEFHSEVAAAGFESVESGHSLPVLRQKARDRDASEQVSPDEEASRMFIQIAPRAVRHSLLGFARKWLPNLILHEETEYGGPLVASQLNIPNVVIGWPAAMRPLPVLKRLDTALADLWASAGLTPVPIGGVYRSLFLDTCPPPLQAAHAGKLCPRQLLRPLSYDAASQKLVPAWLDALPPKPTVHVTFGTVPIYNSALGVFDTILKALSSEAVNIVLTVGEDNDPARFAGDSVFVENYIPHSSLLPHCNLVICHGGCGSTISALMHGLPLLIMPRGGAVQRRNAIACAKAGAARVLYEDEITPDIIRRYVRDLIENPEYKFAAERIREEIQRMPGPECAVDVLHKLAMGRNR